MSNPTIFNVHEAEGAERVQFETTAAAAQIEAPTSRIAREVEANADHIKEAANEAASTAQVKGPSLTGTSAVDQLQLDAKKTSNAAVAEGQHDVEAAKVAGAGYIDQAKSLASNALSTAQSYLPASVTGKTGTTTSTVGDTGAGIVSSLQSGASAALGTTKEYISTAQETAKPHIEHAKGIAQGYLGTAGTQGATPASSTGIPATSAPLESGLHAVGGPYTPATGARVAENTKTA